MAKSQWYWSGSSYGDNDQSFTLSLMSGSFVPEGQRITSVKYAIACETTLAAGAWYLGRLSILDGPCTNLTFQNYYSNSVAQHIGDVSRDSTFEFYNGTANIYTSQTTGRRSLSLFGCKFEYDGDYDNNYTQAFYRTGSQIFMKVHIPVGVNGRQQVYVNAIAVEVEYGGSESSDDNPPSGTDDTLLFTFNPAPLITQQRNVISFGFSKVEEGKGSDDTKGFEYRVTCNGPSGPVSLRVSGSYSMDGLCEVYTSSDATYTFTFTALYIFADGRVWSQSVDVPYVVRAPAVSSWSNRALIIEQTDDNGLMFSWSGAAINSYAPLGNTVLYAIKKLDISSSMGDEIVWETVQNNISGTSYTLYEKPTATTTYMVVASYGYTVGDNYYGNSMDGLPTKYTVSGGVSGGSVQYYDGSTNTWKNCIVHYYTGSEWKPCTLHCRKSDGWT